LLHQVAGAGGRVPPALVQQAPFAILPVSNLLVFERFHMGIALLALSGLFQGLSKWSRPAPIAAKAPRGHAALHPVWATRRAACVPTAFGSSAQPHRALASPMTPALRVLRVTESDQRVKGAGRMVISGRMADVCAELDRLAAIEASQARI